MELLHKTIAQLPQSPESASGAGGNLQSQSERPGSPNLAKVSGHANSASAASTTTELSPSYDHKMFEPPTTQVGH